MSTASIKPGVKVLDKLYINGKWVKPEGTGFLDVINPATEEVLAQIPEGSPKDVNLAVAAAKQAFDSWSQTPPAERARLLSAVVEQLTARKDEIAETIVNEVGTPLPMATAVQAGLPIAVMNSFVKLLEDFQFEEQVGNSLIIRDPVGVVGCITPWNYPLHQIVAKVGAALAAGCTVVLKPSEVAPLTAFILTEIMDQVGVPAGVFNLITGIGPVVGEVLASHPDVDMISLTGSTRAGRQVSSAAAVTLKRVSLELGGKSANIILDDADFGRAVSNGVGNSFFNSGQTCSALTRMLVPRSRYTEAVQIAKTAAEKYTVGDPHDPKTRLGPLVSESQLERVRDYIRKGLAEGATLVTGGTEPPENVEKGYYIKPTIFADVTPDMTIAQEEIFGPVLSIIAYNDEEDAIRIANDSIYGLSGGVWSGDPERAKRVARRLRTGQVDVNGGKFNPVAPFGGYKQSGHGREFGKYGFEEFLEIKSLQL
jgi:aldehyde dehydrogenase (NAD+)